MDQERQQSFRDQAFSYTRVGELVAALEARAEETKHLKYPQGSGKEAAKSHFKNYGHTDYLQNNIENTLKYDLPNLDEFQLDYLKTALKLEGHQEAAGWVKVDVLKAKKVYWQLCGEWGPAKETAEVDFEDYPEDVLLGRITEAFEAWSLPDTYQDRPVLKNFSPSAWALSYLETGLRLLGCEEAAALLQSEFNRAKHLFELCQQPN